MEKRSLLRYLVDRKEQIRRLKVLPRSLEIQKTKQFVIPIIGPRRAGKSFFLYDLILNKFKIKDEDFIYLNFEDPEMIGASLKDMLDAVSVHEEFNGKIPEYIFLDEVQNIDNWEKAVRGLYETKNHYLFISGSSSKLLSKEIATSLRGRTLTYSILPLSFREFLDFNEFKIKPLHSTSDENQIKNNLRKYMEFGGFPDIVFDNRIADRFFKEYLDLVLFRDIIERYNIKNIFIIKFLIKSMLASFSKQSSVNSTFNTLKSQGIKVSKKTLYNYASYLEDSFFAFYLKKFSYSVKNTEASVPKVFINDTGLITSLISGFSENFGRLMENIVFLELKRVQNKNPAMEIYYYKNGIEVDFLIKEKLEIKQLVQVCYDLEDPDTKGREIKALLKASMELKCNDLLVITWDREEEERIGDKNVVYLPLWKWLLT
jgi:predicted AAA+ superfamily ATPase